MSSKRSMMWVMSWIAMLPWLAPTAVWSAPPTTRPAAPAMKAAPTVDLELQPGGVVRGQMLNPAGQPAPGGEVKVIRGGSIVAATTVGPMGRFEMKGLEPGACHLQLLTATQPCRLWAAGTAPPKSPRELLVVTGQPTARGQNQIHKLLTNPLFIGLAVAAAVAIPLAVRDKSGS